MRILTAFLLLATTLVSRSQAALSVGRDRNAIVVKGDHFALTFDLARGGEVTDLRLFDGSQWNAVFSASMITYPAVVIGDGAANYVQAHDRSARLVRLTEAPDRVLIETQATPRTAGGTACGWQITTTWEVYAEGAVFADLDYRLQEGTFDLTCSALSFEVSDEIRKGPKYRDYNSSAPLGGFRSARVGFGRNPSRSFTNEIEAVVEHKLPMTGTVDYQQNPGRFTWLLGGDGTTLRAPWNYRNRIAMGLGAAITGKPKSNAIGHRVFHWVNWLDTKNWYPSNEQIDKMIALDGTMLIMHHEWMKQRGSCGQPHADYAVVRNHDEMVRTIQYAHDKGMRVGLYMRGVEMYGLKANFFQKYLKRDWDGIYMDWHGPASLSWHDWKYTPDPNYGDMHFSEKGTHYPAKEYFLFTRKLRDIIGPGGWLIGHQGPFNPGAMASLGWDAYLPGESASDHDMFADVDRAVYKGMMGGGVCMPWTLDSPLYRSPEGAAKMAAWGFYPHIVLGLGPPRTKDIFSNEPDDPMYARIMPYWRVLSKVNVEELTVYNIPAQNLVAMTSSDPNIQGVVYKAGKGTCLVIVANLGKAAAKATLTLDRKVLGMEGEYQVDRIDPMTGQTHPGGQSAGTLTTTELPQWGIEGFRLTGK
jgi:hypothetical protein